MVRLFVFYCCVESDVHLINFETYLVCSHSHLMCRVTLWARLTYRPAMMPQPLPGKKLCVVWTSMQIMHNSSNQLLRNAKLIGELYGSHSLII